MEKHHKKHEKKHHKDGHKPGSHHAESKKHPAKSMMKDGRHTKAVMGSCD